MTRSWLSIVAHLFVAAVLTVVAVGALSVGHAPPAGACSCAVTNDGESLQRADAVFTGELLEVVEPPAADMMSTADPERFVFGVDDVFKGEVTATQTVVTARSGASCGFEIVGPGPFLVFAYHDSRLTSGARDGELYSHLCSGTRAVVEGAVSVDAVAYPPTPSEATTTTTIARATEESTNQAEGLESASAANDGSSVAWRPIAGIGLLVVVAVLAFGLGHRRLTGSQSDQ